MNAQDILKYGHLTVLRTIEGLPESEWEVGGVCGVWSVKDIIAHLASYELVLADVLSGFLGAGEAGMLKTFQETGVRFNDEQVELRKGKTSADVLGEYSGAHERVMSLVERVPAETLRQAGTLPWYGLEYALDDYIVYGYYGHKREHSAQIAVFRDRLGQ